MIYLDTDFVIRVHDYIIQETGGLAGIRDIGLLENILEKIKNDDYFPYFDGKRFTLFYRLIGAHAFYDGNKRTAIAITACFEFANPKDNTSLDKLIKKSSNLLKQNKNSCKSGLNPKENFFYKSMKKNRDFPLNEYRSLEKIEDNIKQCISISSRAVFDYWKDR